MRGSEIRVMKQVAALSLILFTGAVSAFDARDVLAHVYTHIVATAAHSYGDLEVKNDGEVPIKFKVVFVPSDYRGGSCPCGSMGLTDSERIVWPHETAREPISLPGNLSSNKFVGICASVYSGDTSTASEYVIWSDNTLP